jgi:hypothetical protein
LPPDDKAKIVAPYAAHNVEITNGDGTDARLKKSPLAATHLPDGEAGIIDNNKMWAVRSYIVLHNPQLLDLRYTPGVNFASAPGGKRARTGRCNP